MLTTVISVSFAAYQRTFPMSEVSYEVYTRCFLTHDVNDSGGLYPAGKFSAPEAGDVLLSTLHMQSVPAADLLQSGHTFTMGHEAHGFDGKGELDSCHAVVDDGYFAREGGAGSEPLCDTTELMDDFPVLLEGPGLDDLRGYYEDESCYMSGRWAHLKDAHLDAEHDAERTGALLPTEGKLWGEQGAAALRRYRRCGELVHFARKLGAQVASAKRKGNRRALAKANSVLTKLQRGVQARYAASVKLVVTQGKASGAPSGDWGWWALYLTKAQTERIYREVGLAAASGQLNLRLN